MFTCPLVYVLIRLCLKTVRNIEHCLAENEVSERFRSCAWARRADTGHSEAAGGPCTLGHF